MRETPDFANPHHCGGAFIGGLLAEGGTVQMREIKTG